MGPSANTAADATGALTATGQPSPQGKHPGCLGTELTGRFLYVYNLAGDFDFNSVLAGFAIDASTGGLTNVSGSPFPSARPGCVGIDPLGRFAYTLASRGILAYTIDPGNGSLAPIAGSPFPIPADNGDAMALAIHPIGKFVYVASRSLDTPNSNHVAAYRIDAISGALTPIPLAPFPGYNAVFVGADPAGRFVF